MLEGENGDRIINIGIYHRSITYISSIPSSNIQLIGLFYFILFYFSKS